MVILKRPNELAIMAEAGDLLYQVHDLIAAEIQPGVTTARLNEIAERAILKFGARPAFLGYNGYPATINASINDVVVHGIPGAQTLRDGDIISIDCGLVYRGFVADSARTYAVGEVSSEARRLMSATEAALQAGIQAMIPGNRLGDVSNAVQQVVEKAGFWVVREFVGHGVGRAMHEDPQVPNWGRPGKGLVLNPGTVLAIEPMVTAHRTAVDTLDDGWTAVTHDHSLAAHYEHTVAVTEDGPRILTARKNAPDRA